MHFRSITATATLANIVAAASFSYPLTNGFSEVNIKTLEEIFKLAGNDIQYISSGFAYEKRGAGSPTHCSSTCPLGQRMTAD
jgi:hypothetical protein